MAAQAGNVRKCILLPDSLRRPREEDIQALEDELQELGTTISNLSKEENPTSTHKCLTNQFRELSYDAEDYLEMLRHSGGGCWQINWILCKTKQQRHLRAKDISELISRAKDAEEIWKAYDQQGSSRTTTENSWSCRLQAEPTHRLSISSERLEPKGLDDPMNELVQLLAFDSNQLQLKVVCVHGSSGVGKTTLTRRLYHYYKGRFHHGAFLRVSRKPDTKRLLASLVLQIKGRRCEYRAFVDDQEDIIDNIKQHLQGKSYLIVIDELWDISEWDILSRAFPRENFCSRIIMTTQVKDVALTCCNDHTEHIFKMGPLNDAESMELFNSRVNHIVGYNAEECKEISYEIVRKFGGGLPLAIINIAGMLGGWPDIQMNELLYIKSFLFSALAANPSTERMEGVLTLFYNNLPSKVKTCLLYLSMFPENYVIRKDDLVRQWVAEGIFREVHSQDEELIGNVYFDELLNRGLIQSADTDYNNQVLSCTVHHTVRDFIAQKALQENFITVVDHHETVSGLLDNKVRRLSVRFGDVKCAQIPESLQISLARSLMFSGFFKCIPSLAEYWRIGVLILHIWSDRDRRILDLSVISDLIQLRYVRVKCNMAVKLPAMIRGLQYLQTLDVNARVAAVPVDIFCLPHLLHLHVPCEPFLSFRSVHNFLLPCLNKLTNLLDLHLTCSAAVASSRDVSNIKCLSSILGRFTCLKSLVLDGEASSDGGLISCDSLISVAYPPPGLERLVLSPRIFMLSRLPDWIGDLRDTLCALKISLRGLSDNDVGTLQRLHQLSALSLYVWTTPDDRIIFNRGFQVLKFFKFVCTAPCLQFEKEAMPEVETLKLRFSASTMQQYSLLQVGFEHLIALKLCSAKIEDAGADQVSREGAKHQMLSAFSKHPHVPVINVQLLDSGIYNETGQSANDVFKSGGPDKQYGIRENDLMENINRTADRSRIITSPECSSRVQKPGWVSRRPRNGVRLVKTVRGFTYVVRQHMKQPGFRLTSEVASLVQDMERLKMITHNSSPGSQPEEWVLQVQDLTYDIQDFIDIYSWLCIRSRRHTMAHMSHIVQLKDRIRIVREWQQSGILSHGGSSGIPGSSGPPWSHPCADEDEFIGIEEPMSEMLEILLLPEDLNKSILELQKASSSEGASVLELMPSPTEHHKPTVVSIVGYPGIGKTALARAVYNHPRVRSAFNNCVAWIGASECSNLADLQNKILEQVESNFCSTTLEGILRNNRFLVVIDGLQGAGVWYGIQSVFPKTHRGSRVIVTTSIQSVARTCSPERRYIYRMRGLDYFASERLFWTRVGSRANHTHALECTLEETLRKCGGLPLAVISVANHLCLKDQNLQHGSLGAFEEMNRVLTQSYDSLPDNGHRMCLLSLSMFPQGHLIKRKMLIRKWVAEGLALGDSELNAEQVASNIFDVLIDRNIIEPVLIGNNSKAKGCLVLGVIKDFIINKSVSKEFATIVCNDELLFPNKKIARPVRRLFVHRGTTHSQRVAKGIGLDRVRSLRICNTVPFDFQDCCLLRVLDLEACQGVDKRVLHSICKLVFLKYLSLRGSDVYKISKKIKKLQCLEMLDIRETRVETLPIEVFMLPRLACLFGKFELPRQPNDRMFRTKLQPFLSQKSRLQTLSGFVMVGTNELEHIILKTRLLRKVKLWCNHTITASNQKNIWSSIQELLRGKNALESLSIDFGNQSINFLNDIGVTYSLISSIKLQGRLKSLPTFMTSHNTTLSHLELSSTRLSIEALSLLQSLRQLTYMKLVEGDGFWGNCFIVQRDGFPSLLSMCFEAPELPQFDIHQGGLRSLTCLELLCPVFACHDNYDSGEIPMGDQPGGRLKIVDNNPEKEVCSERNSEEIEEAVSMKRPMESIMETVLEQNPRKNYPDKIKERFALRKHFRGLEHLQCLSELVLHASVNDEVFDAWKKETSSHVKVTRRGGRSMVGKEEEHQRLKQEYEMLDKEPDTRLSIECGNKLADIGAHEFSSLSAGSPGSQVVVEIDEVPVIQAETQKSTRMSYHIMLELRKYIVLLASLFATVTYAAGFSPPGDFWKDTAAGHLAGDPIIRDTNHKRYLAFFYCNATAFAASLVVIVITLTLTYVDDHMDKYSSSNMVVVPTLQVAMVVDLLSLMGAYGAGTCRDTFTTIYSSVLLGYVFFCVVVQLTVASRVTDTASSGAPASLASGNTFFCSGGGMPEPEAVEREEERPKPKGSFRSRVFQEKSFHSRVQVVLRALAPSMSIKVDQDKAKERFDKVQMLLATFAVSITYLVGLSTPGGFWDSAGAGHRPGDAILKDRHNTRLKVFFSFNTLAFITSLLIIVELLSSRKLREKMMEKMMAYGNIVGVLIFLIGAYSAGSCRGSDTTVYVFSLIPSFLVYIPFLYFVADHIHDKWEAMKHLIFRNLSSMKQPANEPKPTDKEKAANKARSLVLLLASLTATITYQAGMDPPGGVWQDNSGGHTPGNPILLKSYQRRYMAFFYCNSVSLVASLVAIVLIQRKLLLKHHVVEAVMILDLFGLIGAYAAGSCRNVSTSFYVVALAFPILTYVPVHMLVYMAGDTRTRSESDTKKDKELVEKTRKQLLLFAILLAIVTYQAGLTPPGGFLLQDDQSGHNAGDPVLSFNFPRRYKAFFYCNSVSFMLSIALIILLSNPKIYRPAIRSHALYVCTALGLFGLMGAYAAGSTQHLKTSIYIFALVAVVIFFINLLFLVTWFTGSSSSNGTTDSRAAAAETCESDRPQDQDNKEEDKDTKKKMRVHAKRKYLMLLGILVASVTYHAGLEPPGGSWQSSSGGYEAGNPVMHDIRRARYLVFFYSNSTSFMASIVVILLVLVPKKLFENKKWHRRWLVVTNTTIVLDLLGLLGAYAAGSTRRWKTSVYVLLLVIAVLAYMAFYLLLAGIIRDRSGKRAQRQASPPSV